MSEDDGGLHAARPPFLHDPHAEHRQRLDALEARLLKILAAVLVLGGGLIFLALHHQAARFGQ